MRPIAAASAVLLLWSAAARAEDASAHFYLAADPLPYALHGFSAHAGALLPGGRFSVEAAVFSSRLGDTLLKLVESGDQGFTADLRGITLEGYWHPVVWDRNALLLGLQTHFDRFTVHPDASAAEASFDQIYLFPTVAYLVYPFDGAGFFLKPFVSAGLPLLSTSPVTVGTRSFQPLRLFPLATVILGYRF